jgi:hypothetical protein
VLCALLVLALVLLLVLLLLLVVLQELVVAVVVLAAVAVVAVAVAAVAEVAVREQQLQQKHCDDRMVINKTGYTEHMRGVSKLCSQEITSLRKQRAVYCSGQQHAVGGCSSTNVIPLRTATQCQ